MQVHELLDLPKTKYKKGFRMKNGRVVWTDVHVDGDRKRIRISRVESPHGYPVAYLRYVKPHTEVELV